MAEIGPTLDSFPKDTSLAAWCGLRPGNNESAGKRKSGKSQVRKNHLKTITNEVAWAAIKKKGFYFKDKYYRRKARRGAKRAIVAIAHRILLGIYHVIRDGADFRDLGGDYLTLRNKSQKVLHLRKQALAMGLDLVPQAVQ